MGNFFSKSSKQKADSNNLWEAATTIAESKSDPPEHPNRALTLQPNDVNNKIDNDISDSISRLCKKYLAVPTGQHAAAIECLIQNADVIDFESADIFPLAKKMLRYSSDDNTGAAIMAQHYLERACLLERWECWDDDQDALRAYGNALEDKNSEESDDFELRSRGLMRVMKRAADREKLAAYEAGIQIGALSPAERRWYERQTEPAPARASPRDQLRNSWRATTAVAMPKGVSIPVASCGSSLVLTLPGYRKANTKTGESTRHAGR